MQKSNHGIVLGRCLILGEDVDDFFELCGGEGDAVGP
jgi:hypothetical protein